MKFVCELSIENSIALPIRETSAYEIYSGYFGKKIRVLKPLNRKLLETIRRLKINHLEFLSFWVESDLDLGLLEDLPGLEALTIHTEVPLDWSPLQRLQGLHYLKLKTSGFKPQSLDFTRFKSLHTAHLTWHQEWSSILECTSLQHLTIEHTRGLPVLELGKLPRLVEVGIRECKGLQGLIFAPKQRVESLSIGASRSLQRIVPLHVLESLKYLAIGGHTRLDLQFLHDCPALRKLWLNGVGKIPTLEFLSACENLEYLQMLFSTNVEDGNLNVLARLPKLRIARFENRRHYSHKASELNELLAQRRSGRSEQVT